MTFDLVFEGGGAKGVVFVGALDVLFKGPSSNAVRRLVGTSAGAITASLVAAGYTPAELQSAVQETVMVENGKGQKKEVPRFATFKDVPEKLSKQQITRSLMMALFKKVDIPKVPGFLESRIDMAIMERLAEIEAYRLIFSFIECGGLYAGDAFLAWIEEKLIQARNRRGETVDLSGATFAQFFEKTGRHLTVVASDTTSQEKLVLNHITAPECPVAWGVRMSMSIPFVWQEVIWQQAWGKYLGEDLTGHSIVDGGALSSFPLDLIVEPNSDSVKRYMGPPEAGQARPLGLLIDETLPVKGVQAQQKQGGNDLRKELGQLKPVVRAERLIDTITKAHDLAIIQEYPERVCHLPAKGYGTTEFDMSPEKREALIQAGRDAMAAYLAQHPA